MESELVNFDMAAFAGESVGVAGEAINAAAIGKFEDVCRRIIFAVEYDAAKVGGGDVKNFGPVLTILEIELRGELVAGGNPDVEFCTGVTGFEDGIKGVGESGANLTGLLPDAHGPGIGEPIGLSGEEEARNQRFGLDRCRQVRMGAGGCGSVE